VKRLGRRIAETRLQSEAGQEQLERDLRTAQVRLGDASKAQAEAREAADAAGQAVADLVRGSAGDSGLTEAAFPMLRSLPSQPSQQAAEWSREDTPDEQPDPQSIATDWRVTVTFDDWGLIRQALRRLRERQIIGDVRRRLGPRVRKGVRDPNLYLYVGSRPVAVALGDVMTEMIAERHVRASVRIHYWNSVDPDWEWLAPATLDVAGKERLTKQRQELEHEYEVTLDANMSRLSGLATWEVRITLRSRSDAVMLTQQLQESGHLVLRQRKRVLIGAESQDEANELAESVKGNAPPGARFTVAPLTSMATKAKHGVSETWLANLDSL
jgi:hypothetical protein